MLERLAFPAAVPTLHGSLVRLRELTEDDIPAWFARASDAESATLAGDPVPESIEAGAEWLAEHRKRFRQRKAIRWAIVPAGSTESVGTIGLGINSPAERTANVGFVIGRAHWGRGYCTEAARLAIGYAFEELGLAEIHGEVLQRNGASIRVLEKAGFQRDRAITADDGEDCYIYTLHA